MKKQKPFQSIKAFYALLTGQFLSILGSGMTRFGLSVWVLSETGDPAAYTTMMFFAVFPAGLGSFFAGPFVDRWDRRKVILVSDIIAGLSTLLVAILYFTDGLALWHLYLALSINGIANAFISPSMQASTPLLVPKEKLNRASGLSQLLRPVENIIAPSVAGFLVSTFSLGAVFIIDFVTLVMNVVFLLLLEIPEPEHQETRPKKSNFWAELMEGVKYVKGQPAYLVLLGIFTIAMFLIPGFAYSLVTPFVLSFQTEKILGIVLSAFGFGSILGGMFLAGWKNSQRRMNGILGALVVTGFSLILIGFWENPWPIIIGTFITGASFIFMSGLNRVLFQVKCAPKMQGRIFALMGTLGVGAQSLGVLVSGPIASNIFEPLLADGGTWTNSIGSLIGTGSGRGMGMMFILLGVVVIVFALIAWMIPKVRKIEDQIPDYDQIE